MVDSSMMPELGYLVDIRHAAVYGSVYAIGDVAFCLGFAIGKEESSDSIRFFGVHCDSFNVCVCVTRSVKKMEYTRELRIVLYKILYEVKKGIQLRIVYETIGPAVSGTLVKNIGFEWMLVGIAIINFIYAPALFMLRAPPTKEEQKNLILGEKSSVRYVNYKNEDEEE